ncbi:MAG: hypothetical protein IPO80_02165 [Propionibacteriaceae bacterium]|nr:hypothetical protein [Propionibacteriaceae bacterium]
MAYYWVTTPELTEEDQSDLGLDQGFDEQQHAEEWLTASYAELADFGVHAVALFDEGRLVYGPMSLEA